MDPLKMYLLLKMGKRGYSIAMLAYQRVGSITILSFGDPGSLGTGGASPLRMKVEGVCMGFLDLLNSTSCQVRVTTNGTRGCFFWNIGLNQWDENW